MSALKYLINKEQDFEDLVEYIKQEEVFAYDTETNGRFSRFEVQLVGMSFGFDDFACYIPLTHLDSSQPQLDITYVLDRLKPIFEDPLKAYVAHNAKFDEMVLGVHGIQCRGIGHDTLVLAWLVNEDRQSKGLKPLTARYSRIQMETYEDVVSKGPKKRGVERDYNFAKVRLADALSYASDDAYYTLKLFKDYLGPLVEKEGIWPAYENIERPLTRVVRDIEKAGVHIDKDYITLAAKKLPEIAEEVEAQIYEEAGCVFKLAGPQLGKTLFETLNIAGNPEKAPKTPSGQYKADKKVLKAYAKKHPVVANILKYKKVQKTYSTFVEGLQKWIEKDGRVHPSFNPIGTVTGRFACRQPNLQQIEGDEVESIKVRNFFVPSEGNVFVVGDYSQIELRILAHLSKDENMINAFLSGKDFHDETARLMLQIQGNPILPTDEVLFRDRFNAKALNFGIPYGRGPVSVGEQLGVDPRCNYWPHVRRNKDGSPMYSQRTGKVLWWGQGEQQEDQCHNCGKCFIEDWFFGYPRVREFKDATIAEARARGFIRTIAGRKRRLLPEIRSSNDMLRSGAERQAFNTRIQGSAGDIIKLAMVHLHKPLADMNAQIILQIHDELVVESAKETSEDVRAVMKEVMEKPLNGKNPLCLPMVTEPKIVEQWGDAK